MPNGRPREGWDGEIRTFSNGSIGSVNALCSKDPVILEQIGSDLVRDWQEFCEYEPVCEPVQTDLTDGFCYGVGYRVVIRSEFLYEALPPNQPVQAWEAVQDVFTVWGAILSAEGKKEGDFAIVSVEAFGTYPSGRTQVPIKLERVTQFRSQQFTSPFIPCWIIDYRFIGVEIEPYQQVTCPPPERCIQPPPFVPKRYTNREWWQELGKALVEAAVARLTGRILPPPLKQVGFKGGSSRRTQRASRVPKSSPRQQRRIPPVTQNRQTKRRDYGKQNRLPPPSPPIKKKTAPPPWKPQPTKRPGKNPGDDAKTKRRRDVPPAWKPAPAPSKRKFPAQPAPKRYPPPVRVPRPVPTRVPSPVPFRVPSPVPAPVSARVPSPVPVRVFPRVPLPPAPPFPLLSPGVAPSPNLVPLPERSPVLSPPVSPVRAPAPAPVRAPGLSPVRVPVRAPGLQTQNPPDRVPVRPRVGSPVQSLPVQRLELDSAPELPPMVCVCPPAIPVYLERAVEVPIPGPPGPPGQDGKNGKDAMVEFVDITVPIASCNGGGSVTVPVLKAEDGRSQAALYQTLFGELHKLRTQGRLSCDLNELPDFPFRSFEATCTYENPVWVSPELQEFEDCAAIAILADTLPVDIRAFKLAGIHSEYSIGNVSWLFNDEVQLLPYTQLSTLWSILPRPHFGDKRPPVQLRLSMRPGMTAVVTFGLFQSV